jgi:hypothetical protein
MSDNVSPAQVGAKIAKESAVSAKTGNARTSSKSLVKRLMESTKDDDKTVQSLRYPQYRTDLESLSGAYHAIPYVSKFFWMIYRLSPVRTTIIIAVTLLQGLLPALRLRTGGDFIHQVVHT